MALPTLTLTDPQNLNADMSLPMSPTIKSPDTFTSFEFERASGRPGTASSVGDGAGKYVIIMIINPPSRCREEAKERSLKLPVLPGLSPKPVSHGLSTWEACHVPPSNARVGACACARIEIELSLS
jgi:hypothetical protein